MRTSAPLRGHAASTPGVVPDIHRLVNHSRLRPARRARRRPAGQKGLILAAARKRIAGPGRPQLQGRARTRRPGAGPSPPPAAPRARGGRIPGKSTMCPARAGRRRARPRRPPPPGGPSASPHRWAAPLSVKMNSRGRIGETRGSSASSAGYASAMATPLPWMAPALPRVESARIAQRQAGDHRTHAAH